MGLTILFKQFILAKNTFLAFSFNYSGINTWQLILNTIIDEKLSLQ